MGGVHSLKHSNFLNTDSLYTGFYYDTSEENFKFVFNFITLKENGQR